MMEFLIRMLALYVPMVSLAVATIVRRPTRRDQQAAVLACIWNVPTLLIVQQLANTFGWWTFHTHAGAQLLGMPLDLLVGWMLLWGALPVLVFPRIPLIVLVAGALALDLLAMPRCAPVVVLAPHWFVGEVIALALCLVPAQLFARWTRDDRHLPARALLQVICFSAFVLWLVPTLAFDRLHTAGMWQILASYSPRTVQILLQLVAFCAVPGLSAVQEFVTRGRGTPVPLDPPRRLVTTGIYAYIANPMQMSATLTLLALGAVLQSWWIAAGSVVALMYGFGFASWVEGHELDERFGEDWRHYRREVHNWLPRWRPYIATSASAPNSDRAATLYVAFTCGKCSEIGRWLQAQRPRGLRIVPAEEHPTRDLWRMTYVPHDAASPAQKQRDDEEEEGIAALARAVEHIHLGWAVAAVVIRLPLIRPCVQLLVDVSGGGPQRIKRVCVSGGM